MLFFGRNMPGIFLSCGFDSCTPCQAAETAILDCRYTDQINVKGEFTKAVLTLVAKHSRPEVASRLARTADSVSKISPCQSLLCTRLQLNCRHPHAALALQPSSQAPA